jgi:hypothetical protein
MEMGGLDIMFDIMFDIMYFVMKLSEFEWEELVH